jgi:hypothetical protein
MVPCLLASPSPVLAAHTTIGCSTGYMEGLRGDWEALVQEAALVSSSAVELSALGEGELPGLLDYLASGPSLPFHFVSVHAPSKERLLDDAALVERLLELPARVDAIVVHPDQIADPAPYRALGRRLVIENMDVRKPTGRTARELRGWFEALPQARFCFDVAHAGEVDPSMRAGCDLLRRYSSRLSHVHVSSLDEDGAHAPLEPEDEGRFAPLLARCADVPWILEAPPL